MRHDLLCATLCALLTLIASPAAANIPHTIKLDASLSQRAIHPSEPTTLYAVVEFTGLPDPSAAKTRAPMHLAMVIDRSSSMAGAKIRRVKEAAHALIDALGPLDTLTIYSYGSDVSRDLPITSAASAEGKKAMRRAIDELELRGATYLSGGLQAGCDTLAASPRQDAISRVLLLSDGQANIGIQDATGLSRIARGCLDRGVSVTTMGVGLDYNEDTMTQLAIVGAGNYFFLQEAQDFSAIFSREAQQLAATTAQRVRLTMELGPGVELLELTGFSHREEGNTVRVDLDTFAPHQKKTLVLKLAVSPQREVNSQQVLKLNATYRGVASGARTLLRSTTLHAKHSTDAKQRRPTREVIDSVERVNTANAMREAMDAYERGDAKAAKHKIQAQRTQLNTMRREYNFDDDASYQRVESELEQLEDQLDKRPAASDEARTLRKSVKARSYNISQDVSSF